MPICLGFSWIDLSAIISTDFVGKAYEIRSVLCRSGKG
ncbi:MAG: hypothetical protein ACI861_000208 [Paracoccaceae bacterium]|jgi:hypothetical protein